MLTSELLLVLKTLRAGRNKKKLFRCSMFDILVAALSKGGFSGLPSARHAATSWRGTY